MLPSKGYFSRTPCVFFLDGGCSRPHCHYRHSHQDISGNSEPQYQNSITQSRSSKSIDSGPAPTWAPDQVNMVTKLVENAVDKAIKDQTEPPKFSRETLVTNTLDKLFADPDALRMASRRKVSRKEQSAPMYNPTPILELTSHHLPVRCIPNKPYSSLIRARPQGDYDNQNGQRHTPLEAAEPPSKNPNTTLDQDCCPESTAQLKTNSKLNIKRGDHSNSEAVNHQSFNTVETFRKQNQPQKHLNSIEVPSQIPLKILKDFNFDCHISNDEVPEKGESKSLINKLALNEVPVKIKQLDQFSIINPANTNDQKYMSLQLVSSPSSVKVAMNQLPQSEEPAVYDTMKDNQKQLNGQTPNEPLAKKKKFEPPSLKISSSADPFIRWMQNKKIRQILGKDKAHKENQKPVERREQKGQSQGNPTILQEEASGDPKIAKRIAHKQDIQRLVPISCAEVKIPSSFRYHFCNAFFQEFKKTLNSDVAKTKAIDEELKLAKRANTVQTYRNICSLSVLKFRRGEVDDSRVQPENFTAGCTPDFTYGWSLYQAFSSYLLKGNELKENGFPLPVPHKPNCAYIDPSSWRFSVQQPENPFRRCCAHCSVEFGVDENGKPTTTDDCFYHWGKLRRTQFKGLWVEKFTCCGGGVDSTPCESSVYHVWSRNDDDCLEDFVETKELPMHIKDHEAGIYALDCEMCYTTKGLELARLTVLNLDGHVVFDQVISIENPILNYCTRFSGIDASKMAAATCTFGDARRWILEHFYDKTILVGHSLENDLRVLKLIHRRIVDTSVTFPHKFGPPHKMSLKHLAIVVLELSIQENVDGHDSKEDAATCLKLMMKKIAHDSKVRKPRVVIGYHGKNK